MRQRTRQWAPRAVVDNGNRSRGGPASPGPKPRKPMISRSRNMTTELLLLGYISFRHPHLHTAVGALLPLLLLSRSVYGLTSGSAPGKASVQAIKMNTSTLFSHQPVVDCPLVLPTRCTCVQPSVHRRAAVIRALNSSWARELVNRPSSSRTVRPPCCLSGTAGTGTSFSRFHTAGSVRKEALLSLCGQSHWVCHSCIAHVLKLTSPAATWLCADSVLHLHRIWCCAHCTDLDFM